MDGAPTPSLANAACCAVVHAGEPSERCGMISCEMVRRDARCGAYALAYWHTICHMSSGVEHRGSREARTRRDDCALHLARLIACYHGGVPGPATKVQP